jgi:DNA-binding NarL/FixJ family response regulator
MLIADDDRLFRAELKRFMTRKCVSVVEAGDGEEALQLAQEIRPDVVLMDITMPRMDGLEATRRIKAVRAETKIIVLTVHDERAYRRAAQESGADAFLVKKTVMAELIPAVTRLAPHCPEL